MTTKQRETIAKAVGTLWAMASFEGGAIRENIEGLAKELDKMLTEDVESTMGQLKPQEPINEPSEPDYTITCADAPMTYTCNRSVCMKNEYNGIDCDECQEKREESDG